MNIATRLKESQPSVYTALKSKYKYSPKRRKRRSRKEKLSEKDIRNLMGQSRSIYKRSKGGSMKQI
ncbi:hypothetical protein [Clostridium cylindrosporum]|uniref:Uncharacterized protein n=1 Tax=Clostridium cylindrosporum DSM 605 TaxID=1121307 RepID=A0A0J8DFP0_CLOCY|nr:hypothetical protein [Clostridium cylindrosporum]KMT22993.1 hypothetical protein CLCY_7c00400 [Clostridium cylindrosporum DSM 605]